MLSGQGICWWVGGGNGYYIETQTNFHRFLALFSCPLSEMGEGPACQLVDESRHEIVAKRTLISTRAYVLAQLDQTQ